MNWKQILWIVIYATIVVIVRYNSEGWANWIWWVLSFVFVAVYGLLGTKKDDE